MDKAHFRDSMGMPHIDYEVSPADIRESEVGGTPESEDVNDQADNESLLIKINSGIRVV
jgi:hypothetical protein